MGIWDNNVLGFGRTAALERKQLERVEIINKRRA